MKILTVVDKVPSKKETKFSPIWEVLKQVAQGSFLPIECATSYEAGHLRTAAKARGFKIERRGKLVFIEGTLVPSSSVQAIMTSSLRQSCQPLDADPRGMADE
jgi:hypothetical protein